MKFQYIILTFFMLFSVLVLPAQNDIPEAPVPARFVTDYVNLLNPEERDYLEKKLNSYYDTTSTQIAVVAMSEIPGGYDIGDFAQRLAEKWGIGVKGKDNGILLLVSKNQRKVWIATGYGMEAYVTDALSRIIIERYIIPDFKTGEYLKGLDKGTSAIMEAATGVFKPELKETDKFSPAAFIFLIILFFIFLSVIGRKGNNYTTFNRRGSMGGTYFGGGWGSGSSSRGGRGGGFGGFGGGSFGGGGAGGSW